MTRRRVRFTINVGGGRQSQLLSIGESASGDLNIIPHFGSTADHPSGFRVPNDYLKMTAHVSPNSNGYTINRRHQYETRDSRYSSWFIEDAKKGFIWPLFGRLSPDLRSFEYFLNETKKKDVIIRCNRYDPDISTLVYLVVISSLNVPVLPVDIAPHRFWFDFRHFRITLFTGVVPGRSVGSGSTFTWTTSGEREFIQWNNQPIPEGRATQKNIVTPDHIRTSMMDTNTRARLKLLHYTRLYYGIDAMVRLRAVWDVLGTWRNALEERTESIDQFVRPAAALIPFVHHADSLAIRGWAQKQERGPH